VKKQEQPKGKNMEPNWRLFLLIFALSFLTTGIIMIVDGLIIKKLSLVGIGAFLIVCVAFFYFYRKQKNVKYPKD